MRRSVVIQGAALFASAALLALSAAPASAAQTVARASASAATLSIAGNGTGTGTYAVTNDGRRQTSTGSNEPAVTVLGGQRLVGIGTLAQDATTRVVGKDGRSAACSGLAGDGASVAQVGEGNCLAGGQNLRLDAGSLDLSHLHLVSSPAFEGMDNKLQDAVLKSPVGATLTQANKSLLAAAAPFKGAGLALDLGAVQSHCTATRTAAQGDSSLADVALVARAPGRAPITIASLPVHPAPNTKVVTNLHAVVDAVTSAVSHDLRTSLGGQLRAVGGGEAKLNKVVDQVTSQIGNQLAPLEQNVLEATLNKQTRGRDSISVTALDLSVLPAARKFVGTDAIHLSVGTSTCGPNGRIVPTATRHAPPPQKSTPHKSHAVPTVVTSGLADGSSYDAGRPSAGRTALLALLVLTAGGAGVAAFRHALRR